MKKGKKKNESSAAVTIAGMLFVAVVFLSKFVLNEYHAVYKVVFVTGVVLVIVSLIFMSSLFDYLRDILTKNEKDEVKESIDKTQKAIFSVLKRIEIQQEKNDIETNKKLDRIKDETVSQIRKMLDHLSDEQLSGLKTVIKYNQENARQLAENEKESIERLAEILKEGISSTASASKNNSSKKSVKQESKRQEPEISFEESIPVEDPFLDVLGKDFDNDIEKEDILSLIGSSDLESDTKEVTDSSEEDISLPEFDFSKEENDKETVGSESNETEEHTEEQTEEKAEDDSLSDISIDDLLNTDVTNNEKTNEDGFTPDLTDELGINFDIPNEEASEKEEQQEIIDQVSLNVDNEVSNEKLDEAIENNDIEPEINLDDVLDNIGEQSSTNVEDTTSENNLENSSDINDLNEEMSIDNVDLSNLDSILSETLGPDEAETIGENDTSKETEQNVPEEIETPDEEMADIGMSAEELLASLTGADKSENEETEEVSEEKKVKTEEELAAETGVDLSNPNANLSPEDIAKLFAASGN